MTTHTGTAVTLPRLQPTAVVRTALQSYRRRFRRVAGTAVALYVPIGLLEAYFIDFGEGYHENHRGFIAGVLFVAVLLVTSASVACDAFFSGFLDAAVGAELHGQPSRPLTQILRTLPYRRLIIGDILLSMTVAGGSLALLLPGLVLFTLFCLIGPLINIERLTVRQAFARSYNLVKHVFVTTALIVTLPVLAEHEVAHALQVWAFGSYPAKALVDGLLAALVYSTVGMIEVTLAYELIERERASSVRPE